MSREEDWCETKVQLWWSSLCSRSGPAEGAQDWTLAAPNVIDSKVRPEWIKWSQQVLLFSFSKDYSWVLKQNIRWCTNNWLELLFIGGGMFILSGITSQIGCRFQAQWSVFKIEHCQCPILSWQPHVLHLSTGDDRCDVPIPLLTFQCPSIEVKGWKFFSLWIQMARWNFKRIHCHSVTFHKPLHLSLCLSESCWLKWTLEKYGIQMLHWWSALTLSHDASCLIFLSADGFLNAQTVHQTRTSEESKMTHLQKWV